MNFRIRLLAILILTFNQLHIDAYQSQLRIIDVELNKAKANVKLSSLVEDIRFVPLSTSEESVIGKIDKILITDDYIFILDRFIAGHVFQFDSNGSFVRNVGRIGPGPKEYQRPTDFTLHNDQIYIMDDGVGVISYDFNGNFVEKKRLSTTNGFFLEKLNTGWALVGGNGSHNLVITDEQFNPEKEFFPYISRSVDRIIINPLFKTSDGTVLYKRNLRDTLYSLSENGMSPYLLMNQKTRPFDISQIDKENSERIMSQEVDRYSVSKQLYEASNTTYAITRFESKNWVTIHKHKSGRSIIFRTSELVDDLTFSRFLYPKGVHKDQIVHVIVPGNFLADIKRAKEKGADIPKEIEKIVDSLSGEDNPILLFIKYSL